MILHSLISIFYFLTNSFKNHINEVIDLAFDDRIDALNVRAFRIMLAIREVSDELLLKLHEILKTTKSTILLHRISIIIDDNSRLKQDSLYRFYIFIPELLNFSDNDDVQHLFLTFARDATPTRIYTRFLQSVNISEQILHSFKSFTSQLPTDKISEKIAGLFSIIRGLCQNEFLRIRFSTSRCLDTITMKFDNNLIHILNNQWLAYITLLDSSTLSYFVDIIGVALFNITNETEFFSEYQVASLNFISKAIQIDEVIKEENLLEKLEETDIYQKIWNCMERYPQHTILHQTIIKFIKQLLHLEHFEKLCLFFIPNLISAYKMKELRVLSATSLYILKKMYKINFSKDLIDKYDDIVNDLKEKFELIRQGNERRKLQSISPSQWNIRNGFFADSKYSYD